MNSVVIVGVAIVICLQVTSRGPLLYHLGCDYFLDDNFMLCFGPRNHIQRMIEKFKWILGSNPMECTSPVGNGNHPKIDPSEELVSDNLSNY
jgi:hypothetical protein